MKPSSYANYVQSLKSLRDGIEIMVSNEKKINELHTLHAHAASASCEVYMHARGRKKTSEGLHGCAVGAILHPIHPNAIKRANKRLRVLHHYVKGVKSFTRVRRALQQHASALLRKTLPSSSLHSNCSFNPAGTS